MSRVGKLAVRVEMNGNKPPLLPSHFTAFGVILSEDLRNIKSLIDGNKFWINPHKIIVEETEFCIYWKSF